MLIGVLKFELHSVDIDLRHDGVRRNQLAALGRPVGEAGTETDEQVAVLDQLVGRGGGKPARNAERPG